MKKLIQTAFVYAIAAMVGGVFYREFTKFNHFTGTTSLSVVHTHLFLLGMVFFLIILLLERQFRLSGSRNFGKFYIIYNLGVIITASMLVFRGIIQVMVNPVSKTIDAVISGVAGLGHILTGTGIILFFIILKKQTSTLQKGEVISLEKIMRR